ncbi:MotE family protein [Gemmobacter denitrificans]|uniref:Magnesium transporter MgtE intracellular domain-containing protein n=1 Tax=Gemmobacter denitrificans TaxID=3123040 RepID=A0ABU8BZZ2_9RHOB
MSRARKRAGRGALFILALLLMASGSLRIGTNVGQALASQGDQATAEPEATPALNCPAPPLALAEALKEREQQVSIRETALEERLAALDLAESVIETRLAALVEAEEKLRATIALADGAAEGDLARLTEVYQAMKPKDAAALFDGMDPEFAAGFLGRMRPEAAAAVLSGMSSERAYSVSAILAGRNANVPRE